MTRPRPASAAPATTPRAAFARLAGILCLGALTLGTLAGCSVGYTNYPPLPGNQWDQRDLNVPNTREVMVLSLRRVLDRYPPAGGMAAINLPEGVTRSTYDLIAQRVGSDATPLTEENASTLPVYHVGRVWTRGRDARVDVLRPVDEAPSGPGGPAYQCITVHLEGGFGPWRVVTTQTRDVGVVPVPPLTFQPDSDPPAPRRMDVAPQPRPRAGSAATASPAAGAPSPDDAPGPAPDLSQAQPDPAGGPGTTISPASGSSGGTVTSETRVMPRSRPTPTPAGGAAPR